MAKIPPTEIKTGNETAAPENEGVSGAPTPPVYKCGKCCDTGLIPTPNTSGSICDCSSGAIERKRLEVEDVNQRVIGQLKSIFGGHTETADLPKLVLQRLEEMSKELGKTRSQGDVRLGRVGRIGICFEGGQRLITDNIGHYEPIGDAGIRIVMAAGAKMEWQARGDDATKKRNQVLKSLDKVCGVES